MRVLFIGSKDRGVRCLNALVKAGINVVGVVTEDDEDSDAFWDGSVQEAADNMGLDVYVPNDINDSEFVAKMRKKNLDIVTMAGFSQILGKEVLEVSKHGVINLHAGKLPAYRGGSPMNWAIINGETTGTATIHYATEKIDAGAVIAEQDFGIGIDDTIDDVRNKTLELFPSMLVDVVNQFEQGTVETREIDISQGIYWGSRLPQDGRINWQTMTAKEVYDFVRALTHPYPGAFTTYQGRRLFVWEAELIDETIKHQPGRICMKRKKGRVVAAKNKGILIKKVQSQDEKEQTGADALKRGEYLK